MVLEQNDPGCVHKIFEEHWYRLGVMPVYTGAPTPPQSHRTNLQRGIRFHPAAWELSSFFSEQVEQKMIRINI